MHPRTREILDHLDRCHTELKDAVAEVPPSLQKTRTAPDRWSVAEIVEHLALVEARIGKLLIPALNEAAAGALENETSSVHPMMDVSRVVDRSQRITAGEASQPQAGLDLEDGLATLEERREELRQAVLAADGRALGAVIRPHPRFGDLNLYQWLLFTGAHEARHAAQVREIAAAGAQGPVAKAQMLIRRPAAQVFEALADPAITSRFWFSKSSGRVETGQRLKWEWEMYGASGEVDVKAVEENRRILVEWGGPDNPTLVEWTFEPRGEDQTFVTVRNWGFAGGTEKIVAEALDSTGGFSFLLAALKAYLEHGIELSLVEDHAPDARVEGWVSRG
jgi:uncharacterized protein YndB with AHSA1/START domain